MHLAVLLHSKYKCIFKYSTMHVLFFVTSVYTHKPKHAYAQKCARHGASLISKATVSYVHRWIVYGTDELTGYSWHCQPL